MKQASKFQYLPLATVILGTLGMALRWALYAFCLDEKFLLPVGHPLELALWVITAVTLGMIFFSVWKLDGSNKYRHNFTASPLGAAGHAAAGVGILLTALLNEPILDNNLGMLWKVLGLLSGPCMVLAAAARYQGKRPFFLLHIVPCLFLVFHIIDHYQLWSGDPQLQDYVFALFGTMSLMFFCYYTAAFGVGSGRRRMQLGMGLAAIYLCLVSLPQTEHLYLYAGGIFFAVTNLCTLTPKPKAKKSQEEVPHEAA